MVVAPVATPVARPVSETVAAEAGGGPGHQSVRLPCAVGVVPGGGELLGVTGGDGGGRR